MINIFIRFFFFTIILYEFFIIFFFYEEFLIILILIFSINNESRILIFIPKFSIMNWLKIVNDISKILIHTLYGIRINKHSHSRPLLSSPLLTVICRSNRTPRENGRRGQKTCFFFFRFLTHQSIEER